MAVKSLRLALLLLLAAPGAAHAGDVAMVARDVPLGPRALQAAAEPIRFDMVGLHWQGPGAVLFRTHRLGGGWSAWTAADADTGPDASSPEAAATRGWRDGNVAWTGPSDRIAFRTAGVVRRLRAYYLWSRVVRTPLRTVAAAGSPLIVSRFSWGANERIVRAKPLYAPTLRLAIVHHTVNANAYSPAQAAAIVRGIEAYHVLGNGWNDIGYNFLIDRYGRIYEGRAGGIDRNVIGAHALGFNTGSVGVALIGTYTAVGPTSAQRAALVRLLAWRLDVAHVDPLSFPTVLSGGNPRFPKGAPVTLRAISGHRDTYFTECPGNVLYGQLPAIAKAVSRTGLPKIYAPLATPAAPEAVRFTATLSGPEPWTVTVRDRAGGTVAVGRGSGSAVDWTWDGVATTPGPYTWTIEAAGARPAAGTIGGSAPPPLLGGLAVPSVVAPAPDGSGAVAHVTFALGRPAAVTVQVLDAGGNVVLTPVVGQQLAAGRQAADVAVGGLPDGRYRLVVSAGAPPAKPVTAAADLVVDRTLTGFAAAAPAISPNGDGVQDAETFSFALASPVPLQLEIERGGVPVATVLAGTLGPGPQTATWAGRDGTGAAVPDGSYQAVLSWTDALGPQSIALPLVVDTTPPTLQLLDPATLRFRLSEPATLTLTVDGVRQVVPEPAGTFAVAPPPGGVQSLSAQATDAAGNAGATVSWP